MNSAVASVRLRIGEHYGLRLNVKPVPVRAAGSLFPPLFPRSEVFYIVPYVNSVCGGPCH